MSKRIDYPEIWQSEYMDATNHILKGLVILKHLEFKKAGMIDLVKEIIKSGLVHPIKTSDDAQEIVNISYLAWHRAKEGK